MRGILDLDISSRTRRSKLKSCEHTDSGEGLDLIIKNFNLADLKYFAMEFPSRPLDGSSFCIWSVLPYKLPPALHGNLREYKKTDSDNLSAPPPLKFLLTLFGHFDFLLGQPKLVSTENNGKPVTDIPFVINNRRNQSIIHDGKGTGFFRFGYPGRNRREIWDISFMTVTLLLPPFFSAVLTLGLFEPGPISTGH
ncbi:hypothetical protein DAPPUDRAFT_236203 [Daphnia pulex]|uniref:Uncharacterized protein n=1 Tax=Daphnia pulex TaxID=6669 RepID=E9G1I6_DAPPU|nr:hypothetical protein DAPPUDRAFT_236203 [Daphnia pulex]|eukprot:EFX86504.1 hypothetical protein DAPPUDRAFT_236203 [Daphnia pulex]